MSEVYIAVDLGGGSGRVMAGTIDGGRLRLECVHRFRNRQVRMLRHIHWDVPALLADIKEGLARAAARGMRLRSIGIDTWGVDFGLVDRAGNLLGHPVCYRDTYTEGLPERVLAQLDARAHYGQTGTQVMPINSLFQLLALTEEDPDLVGIADRLLFMPDLFSYLLCGSLNTEPSIASTSEMLDATTGRWAVDMIDRLGLPAHILPEIVPCGTLRGYLTADVCREIGVEYRVPVVAVGSHDTASAVQAMPPAAPGEVRAFLSSGTWSLLGVELDEPVLSEAARQGGFTNERGADGRVTLLQNITGLWIVQCLVARWAEQGLDTDFATLIPAARAARTDTIIDVDDPAFHSPRDMEEAIRGYCSAHGLQAPSGPGEMLRCVLRSLADRYRRGIAQLNALLPEPVTRLHIIGGGARNALLNELTGQACGIPVSVGPYEATAVGNILKQAQAMGDIASPADITEISEL